MVSAATVMQDFVTELLSEREDYTDCGVVDAEDLPAPLIGLTLDQLSTQVFPPRKALLSRGETVIFRAGHLASVNAERGVGKTLFLQSLSLVVATGREVLGFQGSTPCRVLYVDGEMASEEIKDRFDLLRDRLGIYGSVPLTVVAADWQERYLPRLDTPEGQLALEPYVDNADFIVLDNRSCLLDPDGEKDPRAWQPTQDWLLSLRRRGKAVMLGHHSNRMGGARGHSKAEDPMNLLIQLTRPEDYEQEQGARFTVTFTKSRGAHGASMAPFVAHLTPDGWQTQGLQGVQTETAADRLIDYLQISHQAGDRPKSANAAVTACKIGRNAGLKAWAQLLKAGTIRQHHEGGFFVP
jgi:putative DNA primase/helicase